MKRYIDKDNLIKRLTLLSNNEDQLRQNIIVGLIHTIEHQNNEDVEQIRHGRWISVPYKLSRICSICESDEPYKNADEDADIYDYCPHCGAKMDANLKTVAPVSPSEQS